jgi:glutamate racemase
VLSGLGGLIVAKAIRKMMPAYDYVYLGDTKRVPYGNRSHEAVYEFTREGVDYLFRKENCAIVIIACNTASARALRKIQKKYLPKNYPNRKVLGVLIPAAEEAAKFGKVGIIGTAGTVASGTFPREIKKILAHRSLGEGGNKSIKIFQNSAPMLVPLAEEGEIKNALPFLQKYLQELINKSRRSKKSGPRPNASGKLDALVLGCTHYPIFKKEIKKLLPKNVRIISQDEIVPKKLRNYLEKHSEISKKLSKRHTAKILVTDMTQSVKKLSKKWFGVKTKPKLINL